MGEPMPFPSPAEATKHIGQLLLVFLCQLVASELAVNHARHFKPPSTGPAWLGIWAGSARLHRAHVPDIPRESNKDLSWEWLVMNRKKLYHVLLEVQLMM